ncbi:unnamed protein product [Caenorhabditis auriculariae]|uniref:BHLH domain-containing protein n=1 Tax=Caenorhabditis auriculariae TaxID=2777116 RepID=A0A8S1HQF9_9PELO|nr:unnamed protein product [Caenorhabditis auriculariae]
MQILRVSTCPTSTFLRKDASKQPSHLHQGSRPTFREAPPTFSTESNRHLAPQNLDCPSCREDVRMIAEFSDAMSCHASPSFSMSSQSVGRSLSERPKEKREKRKYRCRKRSPATIERAKTVRRDKANARERRRMNSLNDALELLRSMIPSLPDEPKMTKIETLRKAQEYISQLSMLASSSPSSSSSEEATPYFSSLPCSEASSVDPTPYTSPSFPPPQHAYAQPAMMPCHDFYYHSYPSHDYGDKKIFGSN